MGNTIPHTRLQVYLCCRGRESSKRLPCFSLPQDLVRHVSYAHPPTIVVV